MSDDGRRFSPYWFKKTLPNNEVIDRNWLIYSKNSKAVFCFPCCLFKSNTIKTASIACTNEGFSDWKNINRILDHEKSADHRNHFLQWKSLENRLKNSQCIDDKLQKAILVEKDRWRHILRIILDAILFCTKNNLAFRGSSTTVGNTHSGIFLNLIELLSKYDNILKQHLVNHNKGAISYISPKIQNEFICLLGQTVRNKILSKIKKAKYFSLLFDCTPDVSHNEQMAEVIRYVDIDNGKITVEESFIDFINTEEKTGDGLAMEILSKLKADELDVHNVRGQGYDNGANMSGKYHGVQAVILNKNNLATFIPCAAHCLNLSGVHAASANVKVQSFFDVIQKIYTFFVKSTTRWKMLMETLKISLKGHSDTRWASKAQAVKAMNSQIKEVFKVLQNISDSELNLETKSTAKNLLQLINFDFLCLLNIWNQILSSIDRVNQALQNKSLSLEKASNLLLGLKNALQEIRDTTMEDNFTNATKVAEELQISTTLKESRTKKRKRLELYETDDDVINISAEQNFRITIIDSIDILLTQMTWRYEKIMEISNDFEFLSGHSLTNMNSHDLQKAAADLGLKYNEDINTAEIVEEIKDFKHAALSILPSIESVTFLDLLQMIHDYKLKESYPNIEIAIRIFLSMPVTTASCERSFSKLKLIKTYLRSTMAQERLSSMAILSIETEIASKLDYEEVIDKFADTKARKISL